MDGFDRAEEAEAHLRRAWALRRMDEGELKAVLSGDAAKVAPWIESAARYGSVQAQLRLGQMRLEGLGGERDPAAARRWFERAARAGSAEAMNMAGRCHENGWGGPVRLDEAARWYRASAESGCDWGQYNWANLLFDGRGAPCDQAEAVLWYRRAADQGHARAMNLLGRCHEEGWGVARDPARAYEWYRRSAEGGYFRAQYNVATVLLAQGRIAEALERFDLACREAIPASRRTLIEALTRQEHPQAAALGRRLAEALMEAAP